MRVRLSTRARADLHVLIRHIALDSPTTARVTRDRIWAAIERLKLHPEIGRAGRVGGTRELFVPRTSHIVAYRVSTDTLEIIAIIHESQQWSADL